MTVLDLPELGQRVTMRQFHRPALLTLTHKPVRRRRADVQAGARGLVSRVLAALVAVGCVGACRGNDDRGLLNVGCTYPQDPPTGEALLLTPADLPEGVTVLRLGITPYTTRDRASSDLEELLAFLGKRVGRRMEFLQASSYGELVEAVTRRSVDIAILSPMSYVEAKRAEPGLQLVGRSLTHGATDYASYLVVRVDDPARSVEDLRGRHMAWVDPLSASGFLYPSAALQAMGRPPDKLFGQQTFYGTHDDAVAAVVEGRADVAAVASGIFERLGRSHRSDLDRGNLRVLYKAGRIPYDAVVVRADMPRAGAQKIGWAFVGLSTRTAEGRRVLGPTWSITGWIPADDSVYDGVRAVLQRATTASVGLATQVTHAQ